jgi:hypothetical protein
LISNFCPIDFRAVTPTGNCFGIAIVFLLGYLVTLRTTFVDVYSPASIFIVSVMAACLALLLTFQGATSICQSRDFCFASCRNRVFSGACILSVSILRIRFHSFNGSMSILPLLT